MPESLERGEDSMGRPKSGVKAVTMRVADDAHKMATVASEITGETLVDMVSRILRAECSKVINVYNSEVQARMISPDASPGESKPDP